MNKVINGKKNPIIYKDEYVQIGYSDHGSARESERMAEDVPAEVVAAYLKDVQESFVLFDEQANIQYIIKGGSISKRDFLVVSTIDTEDYSRAQAQYLRDWHYDGRRFRVYNPESKSSKRHAPTTVPNGPVEHNLWDRSKDGMKSSASTYFDGDFGRVVPPLNSREWRQATADFIANGSYSQESYGEFIDAMVPFVAKVTRKPRKQVSESDVIAWFDAA